MMVRYSFVLAVSRSRLLILFEFCDFCNHRSARNGVSCHYYLYISVPLVTVQQRNN